MNKFTFATVAATALSAVIGLAAPAAAAPSGTGSAQDIINSLEASGYKVVLNKLGDAPLIRPRWWRCGPAARSPTALPSPAATRSSRSSTPPSMST